MPAATPSRNLSMTTSSSVLLASGEDSTTPTQEVKTTIQQYPLTTVFTPPPECATPFFRDGCHSQCSGDYPPFLQSSGTLVRCLPGVIPLEDGDLTGVNTYSPGLYCPHGMTTAASLASRGLNVCCPSGALYGEDYNTSACHKVMTTGPIWYGSYASIGYTGSILSADEGVHLDASSFYVLAEPVYLAQPSDLTTSTQPSLRTDAHQSMSTGTPQSSTPTAHSGVSSYVTAVKVGAALGSVLGLVLLSALLGYFLLMRYRRKRLAARHLPLHSEFFKMDNEVAEAKNSSKSRLSHREQHSDQPYSTHVRLNRMSGYVELEGTPVEEPGPGIYVFKPELEGTAGIPGLSSVYVRKKSELFAESRGTVRGR